MPDDNRNSISASELKSIAKEVLSWINANCPFLPNGLKLAYQYLGDSSGMSFHTLKGTTKREVYVDGGYMGYYPFAIYLRDVTDTNATRLECNDTLDIIGAWVSEQETYPDIGTNKYITSIEQVSNSTLVKRLADGVEDYMATFDLLYEKE